MQIRIGISLALLAVGYALSSCVPGTSTKNDLAMQDALASFTLEEGFKIELLAAEPLIGDPVDMEIDEFGRLYVVEMPGYPLDKSGSGKVKLLTDTNGDGMMDSSITFAENLILPNSVMRWKKGLLVTDAPNVLYFEDTNGDGRADLRDTLLTGFALSNPQHNLNSPLLGIDNWIYLAHEGVVSTETYKKEFGDPGGEIYYPGHPANARLPKNASGRSVRFRPDTGQLEELSSDTQFGHTFDQWGNHFLVGNANHIYHEALAERYLRRNPSLLLSDATQSISDHGNAAEVFPTTENPEHQLLTDIGVITSACGLTAYTGGSFPEPYNEDVVFVAEPVSNLVHVDRVKKAGATFTASRLRNNQEFLTSTDAKFRPVNLYVGPDGALYVVDYYRQIIEHPEWMSKEVIESGKLYNDIDKGRIYRISRKDAKPPEWTKGVNLGTASDEELVSRLSDTNSWWRQNAQRLLIDRNASKSIHLLDELTQGPSIMGRLHALWTLEGLRQLKPAQVERALEDPVAGNRENAIRLAELHLGTSPALANKLLTLKSDSDARVRFQLLCTLGSLHLKTAQEAREHLLFQQIDDKWVQAAAMSAAGDPASLLAVVLSKFNNDLENDRRFTPLAEKLVAAIISRNKKIGNELTGYLSAEEKRPAVQAAILEGIAQGLQNYKSALTPTVNLQNVIVQLFFTAHHPAVRKAALHVTQALRSKDSATFNVAIKKALAIAQDHNHSEDQRSDALDFVAVQNPAEHRETLMKLFVPQEPLTVQLAALRSLSAIPDTTVSHYLLENWTFLTPQLQDAAVLTFLENENRIAILLDAIERGKVLPSSINWPRRVGLMAQDHDVLRARARAIFTENDEQQVNKDYQSALQLTGDIETGMEVYQKNCALCHNVRGKIGRSIGPDLGTIHNWSPAAIMAHTLAPNLSISSGFDLWSIELHNGETIQGIIASESPSAMMLRNVGSLDRTINRSDIKSIEALNMSIMPSNLDQQITKQEMADLLAFLKQNK